MRRFPNPAPVVAVIYVSLIVGFIVSAQSNDLRWILYLWWALTIPWVWIVDQLPHGEVLAIVLNAATMYAIAVLGIAIYRKVFGGAASK
jgi:hypothetical protein